MSFHPLQFLTEIVRPSLNRLETRAKIQTTEMAERLLVLTCYAESLGGTYLKQVGGPALGIYQMEPFTHNDIWKNFLTSTRMKDVRNALYLTLGDAHFLYIQDVVLPFSDALIGNLEYATMMARIHYYRVPTSLPSASNAHSANEAVAQYWKDHYNTHLGAGTVQGALEKATPALTKIQESGHWQIN